MKDDDRGVSPLDEEPEEGGGTVDGECVLVPEGEYELRIISHETAIFFGQPKVIVHCAIVAPEDYAGLPIERFYNVKKLTGPPGINGNFKAPRRGDLVREFSRLVGREYRPDRIRYSQLRDKRIVGEIQTVRTDYNHERLDEDDQYSRIKRLLEMLPDEDW